MLERRRPQRQSQSLGGGSDDLFSNAEEGGLVTLSHGVYTESLPIAQMTIRDIRERFSDRFDIDPASTALLDGNEVSEDTVVHSNQFLMFVRKAGVKGFESARVGGLCGSH